MTSGMKPPCGLSGRRSRLSAREGACLADLVASPARWYTWRYLLIRISDDRQPEEGHPTGRRAQGGRVAGDGLACSRGIVAGRSRQDDGAGAQGGARARLSSQSPRTGVADRPDQDDRCRRARYLQSVFPVPAQGRAVGRRQRRLRRDHPQHGGAARVRAPNSAVGSRGARRRRDRRFLHPARE